MELTQETLRQIIELAVTSGRKKQSSQTGFIHFCYHAQAPEERDAIPILENFMFALALLRTRTSENVLEARALLDKLLHFQPRQGDTLLGNFPIYIHDYPNCKDRYVAVHLLPVIYWILKSFQLVLGSELRQKLETSAQALLTEVLEFPQKHKVPLYIAIKIAASAQAFGELLHQSALKTQGTQLLAAFRDTLENGDDDCWYSPSLLADILIGLQMAYPSIANSPWASFWELLSQTWHRKLCCYVGPAVNEFESGHEPQATLYDLFMGYFNGGQFSALALKPNLFQLHGALIQPCEDSLQEITYPLKRDGNIDGQSWHMVHEEERAYSVVQQKGPFNMASGRGFHPLRIVWGDAKRVHTFVCQGGNATEIDFAILQDHITLSFAMTEAVQLEDREKSRDIIFFVDEHEGISCSVGGSPSNTFHLDDEIKLKCQGAAFGLKFSLAEGHNASYFGHFMRGNRPSQINLKGDNRFKAFDWQLFLRAVRREPSCRVKVDINLLKE